MREWFIPEDVLNPAYANNGMTAVPLVHVINYQNYQSALKRIEALKAKNDVMREALEYVCRVTYGTEFSNTKEENNEILARHYFNSADRARLALEKIQTSTNIPQGSTGEGK